jgi:hypothetical protein
MNCFGSLLMLFGVANLAAQRFLQDTSLWRQRFRVNLAIFEVKIFNFFSLVFVQVLHRI